VAHQASAKSPVAIEFIIVDDCSTDETVATVRALDDPRIRFKTSKRRECCVALDAPTQTPGVPDCIFRLLPTQSVRSRAGSAHLLPRLTRFTLFQDRGTKRLEPVAVCALGHSLIGAGPQE
jgi:glycosyltransferase involved in cell wall biosynthesis